MQGLFVLRFYLPDKTDKIDRLINASGSKMALKMSRVVQTADVCIKIVSCYRWQYSLFSDLQ